MQNHGALGLWLHLAIGCGGLFAHHFRVNSLMKRAVFALLLAGLLVLTPRAFAQETPETPAAETPHVHEETPHLHEETPHVHEETPDVGINEPIPELTADSARRAFDAYLQVQEKFSDAAFEEYDSLDDFVKRAPEGKDFEAMIRTHGFADVPDWINFINALEFTLASFNDNQESDLRAQIAEVKADATVSAEDKARIVESLEAAIPSANNRQVVEEMMKDPAYAEKLKGFTSEE
jgi:hypothetical protein